MKHYIVEFNHKKEYKKIVTKARDPKYRSILIQVYCGVIDKKHIQKILKRLHNDFPQAVIIGATTAGEIAHAKMHEESTVVSVSLFKETKLALKYSEEVSTEAGKAVAKEIVHKDTQAMIVLAEGLNIVPYEAFLNGIKSTKKEMIIAGGLAGDNFALKKTYIFEGENIYNKGTISLSFSSKKLYATNKYNLNWTPIGREFVLTKVEDNVVLEIDHAPAVDIFKKYLGEEVFEESSHILANFQLLFQEGDTTVARTPLVVDGKNIVLAGPIDQGKRIRFGFSNEALVLDGSQEIQEQIADKSAEAIYVFSCIARKTLLDKVLEKEFHAFEKIAPTVGFFTYGEFYSTSNSDVLLNCTTTILVLSEKHKKGKKSLNRQKRKTLDGITFNALSHFIEQTSKELQENIQLMNQYKNIVDATFLVSKTDRQGKITYVNENFCKVSKYSAEELLGRSHNIVRDPETSPFIFKKMWRRIESGKIWRGIFSNIAKDGSKYYVHATVMPIFDERGEIKEYIAIRQNITKQILSKKRAQEKEKLIRAIFDNQDSIVIHASKFHGMQGVNKKLFEFFDYKDFEDFKNRRKCICELFLDFEGYVTPEKMPNWLDDIAEDEGHDYKVKMQIKTGEIHTFTIKIKKIDEEYIINLYDITQLENALLKAYSSEKAKSLFLANMSHEIRTPLNGILGFTDILIKKELPVDIKKYIDIIHTSGETLLNVVNDILDFSKIESGELSLFLSEVNLFKEMEHSAETFASIAKQKKVNYYTYIDTRIPKKVRCDAQRLKQVINNLISNAIKFTPHDGEVAFRIELKEIKNKKARLHFSVQDTGIGIEEEKLDTIFDAFSQADNSISREFGGTGLGLSISNEYIALMGSKIKVKSRVGEGSTFYFDVDFEVLDTSSAIVNNLQSNKLRITVLESNHEIVCGINEIIHTYLDAWKIDYIKAETLGDIHEKINILILCARLVDIVTCQELLQKYQDLHIIYIEGIDESFRCEHERFNTLEQPITGSTLFNKLITLIQPNKNIDTNIDKHTVEQQQFIGKVLIAEDNETNQLLISLLLEERGIEHILVNNGQEAIDELEQNSDFDLVFMDINMPLLDGIDATRILRQRGFTLPIVSLSANVIDSDTQAYREAGMDDTINKPIVPEELDIVLERYLEKKKNQPMIELDEIDLSTMAQSLSLPEAAVKKLLFSLLSSLRKARKELLDDATLIEDDVYLHRLKGVSGNMRMTKLYQFVELLEKKIPYNDQENMMVLLQHLDHIIAQIENLGRE